VLEKLTAMRLLGMVDALKAQELDAAARELSFLERLGLLVDRSGLGARTRLWLGACMPS
jgi:hypothetical protein